MKSFSCLVVLVLASVAHADEFEPEWRDGCPAGNMSPRTTPPQGDLLRRGLTDPQPGVRAAAAALAFSAVRGASFVGELVANLGRPERSVRWWSILALGAAHDPVSCELLVEELANSDAGVAAAAARALGQRPDGQDGLVTALADPRTEVQDSATFAIKTVATNVPDLVLARLEADPRAHFREAVASYRARALCAKVVDDLATWILALPK